MGEAPTTRRGAHIRVILSPAALASFTPAWRAAALAFAELGASAFFAIGIAQSGLGPWAPWALLGAGLLSGVVRGTDIASWALFVPGGLVGRAR